MKRTRLRKSGSRKKQRLPRNFVEVTKSFWGKGVTFQSRRDAKSLIRKWNKALADGGYKTRLKELFIVPTEDRKHYIAQVMFEKVK